MYYKGYYNKMNGSKKPYLKITTFTKRPGVPQVASYIVFVLQTVLFYAVILPKLNQNPQIIFGIIYSLTLIMLVISTLVSSSVDPSDRVMVQYRNHPRQEFEQYRRGITAKLLYCEYCSSYVRDKSRHCKACDRCVQNFDHHCMWINNCVGGLNYRSFFLMIIFAFSNLLTYVVALLVLTLQFTSGNFLGGFIAAWFSGGINSIFVILLVNLIILHMYLMHKGISTYEFIMAQRQEERKQKQQLHVIPRQTQTHKIGLKKQIIKNQIMNEEGEVKSIQYSSNNVIKVKNSQKEEEESSSNLSNKQKQKIIAKSVIFGVQNDLTEKSQNYEQNNNKVQILHNDNQGDSQQQSSIQLSQLFTRNKSLKLILGKNEFYKPHRTIQDRQNKNYKSKSMFTKI